MSTVASAEVVATLPAVPHLGGGLVAAICAISSKMETVTKLGVNEFHKYTYARMPDLMRVLGPLMTQHGVTVLQSETEHALIADGVLRVEFYFDIVHAPSGEVRTIRSSGMAKVTGDRGGFNDRAFQAIATTTRKYVLIALFNVVVEDLPDVDHATVADPRHKTTLLKRDQAPAFNRLRGELDAIASVGDLQQWGDDNGGLIATFRADWQKALRLRYTEKLAELRPTPQVVRTVVPAPKASLRAGGIAERAIEARQFGHRSGGPSQPFLATKEGPRALPPIDEAAKALNRCLHPMNDELPGDLGPPKAVIDHTDIDGTPAFLCRKANGKADDAEPTFVDLVGGDR
jgi:hypothetical protein